MTHAAAARDYHYPIERTSYGAGREEADLPDPALVFAAAPKREVTSTDVLKSDMVVPQLPFVAPTDDISTEASRFKIDIVRSVYRRGFS